VKQLDVGSDRESCDQAVGASGSWCRVDGTPVHDGGGAVIDGLLQRQELAAAEQAAQGVCLALIAGAGP
jgi:hypothetical protein